MISARLLIKKLLTDRKKNVKLEHKKTNTFVASKIKEFKVN